MKKAKDIRILLLEDSDTDQILIKRYLRKLGIVQISYAKNEKVAKEYLTKNVYDILLLDTYNDKTKDKHGIKIAKEAKKLLNLDYIIIAMSGSKEARKEWEELGNHHNYFLDKNEIINKDGQPLTEIIRNHYKDIDFN